MQGKTSAPRTADDDVRDIGHSLEGWTVSELAHEYGPNVHILTDPYYATLLARLCSPETRQPVFNQLVQRLYEGLCRVVVNCELPRRVRRVETRLRASTERGVLCADFVDPETPVLTIDIARAGILPSMTCFELLTSLMSPDVVRQGHVFMQRVTNDDGQVVGVEMNGSKIGGPVEGQLILLPDPMGATGSSMCQAIEFLRSGLEGTPAGFVCMNLIVTPEYLARLRREHPDARVYALRLDRGLSPKEVLEQRPGARWSEEVGLNDVQYIVPGGGGLGELMNNALV